MPFMTHVCTLTHRPPNRLQIFAYIINKNLNNVANIQTMYHMLLRTTLFTIWGQKRLTLENVNFCSVNAFGENLCIWFNGS